MGSNFKQPPSANWLALQKVGELLSYPKRGQIFKVFQKINPDPLHRRKKRKLDHETTPEQHFKRGKPPAAVPASTQNLEPLATALPTGMKNGESIDSLRRMILGELEDQYTDHQKRYVSEHRASRDATRLMFYKGQGDTSLLTVKWLEWASTARSLRSHVLVS